MSDDLSGQQAPHEPEIIPIEPEPQEAEPHHEPKGDSLMVFAGLAILFIVIITIIGGVVAYFELYASPSKTADYCFVGTGIQCVNWRLGSSGDMELEIANGHTEKLFIDEFACSTSDAPKYKKLGIPVASGGTALLALSCTNDEGNPAGGLLGDLFEGKLYAKYHLESEANATHSAQGVLRTRRKTLA